LLLLLLGCFSGVMCEMMRGSQAIVLELFPTEKVFLGYGNLWLEHEKLSAFFICRWKMLNRQQISLRKCCCVCADSI